MSVYEQVKQALQDIVAPELKAIQVEIKRLDSRIDSVEKRLDSGINSVEKKLEYGISSLEKRIDSLKAEMTSEIRRLDEKIDGLDEKVDRET
ncbi:MAG TPA: hypothetical protein VJ440_01610 [Candidatus Brocadiaceae bacterium]|nr:hypothetical protein [Candidatus Brocadiaceae bacterium]